MQLTLPTVPHVHEHISSAHIPHAPELLPVTRSAPTCLQVRELLRKRFLRKLPRTAATTAAMAVHGPPLRLHLSPHACRLWRGKLPQRQHSVRHSQCFLDLLHTYLRLCLCLSMKIAAK